MEKNISFIRIPVLTVKVKSGLLPVFLMELRVGVPCVVGTIMAPITEAVDAVKLINIFDDTENFRIDKHQFYMLN